MNLDELRRHWNRLGAEAPLRAVQTRRRDPWDEESFFRTGQERVEMSLELVASAGLSLNLARALDFGCGVGRLVFPLADRFRLVDGVDISESMLAHARKFLAERDPPPRGEVRFCLNTTADLSLFPDSGFSYVQSFLTLQHMKPELSRGYIAELCRITAPGGIVVFQLPERRRTAGLELRGRVGRFFRRWKSRLVPNRLGIMEMYGLPRSEVAKLIESNGLDLVASPADREAGSTWNSFTFIATRR